MSLPVTTTAPSYSSSSSSPPPPPLVVLGMLMREVPWIQLNYFQSARHRVPYPGDASQDYLGCTFTCKTATTRSGLHCNGSWQRMVFHSGTRILPGRWVLQSQSLIELDESVVRTYCVRADPPCSPASVYSPQHRSRTVCGETFREGSPNFLSATSPSHQDKAEHTGHVCWAHSPSAWMAG